MLEGERYTPPEAVEEGDRMNAPEGPTELQPVEEVPPGDAAEATPYGDPGPTYRPDIGTIGVDNVPLHKPPDLIQERLHGGAQKPGFDHPPSGVNSNPPLEPDDIPDANAAATAADDTGDSTSTQQTLDEVADLQAELDQELQADVEAFDNRPRPAYMDVEPVSEQDTVSDNYVDPADYEVDYSVLENVTEDEQKLFDYLNETRVAQAQEIHDDAAALTDGPPSQLENTDIGGDQD